MDESMRVSRSLSRRVATTRIPCSRMHAQCEGGSSSQRLPGRRAISRARGDRPRRGGRDRLVKVVWSVCQHRSRRRTRGLQGRGGGLLTASLRSIENSPRFRKTAQKGEIRQREPSEIREDQRMKLVTFRSAAGPARGRHSCQMEQWRICDHLCRAPNPGRRASLHLRVGGSRRSPGI